jgi:hypothetical protein
VVQVIKGWLVQARRKRHPGRRSLSGLQGQTANSRKNDCAAQGKQQLAPRDGRSGIRFVRLLFVRFLFRFIHFA